MILLAILASTSVIDAERAFAKLAQEKGQWTAFRATASKDAVMFVPEPINARTFLSNRKDPHKSVEWWPTAAWTSCDGSLGVTTGGAVWPDGRHGYFTTVWRRQKNGWRWIVDHGADVAVPRKQVVQVRVVRASCVGKPTVAPPMIGFSARNTVPKEGSSLDHSLAFRYIAQPSGARWLYVSLWNGAGYTPVVEDNVSVLAK